MLAPTATGHHGPCLSAVPAGSAAVETSASGCPAASAYQGWAADWSAAAAELG